MSNFSDGHTLLMHDPFLFYFNKIRFLKPFVLKDQGSIHERTNNNWDVFKHSHKPCKYQSYDACNS